MPQAYDGVDGTGGVRDRDSRYESQSIPLVSSGEHPAAEPGCVAESPKSGGTFDPGCCGRARPPGSGEETLLPATCVLAKDGQLRKSERRNLVSRSDAAVLKSRQLCEQHGGMGKCTKRCPWGPQPLRGPWRTLSRRRVISAAASLICHPGFGPEREAFPLREAPSACSRQQSLG